MAKDQKGSYRNMRNHIGLYKTIQDYTDPTSARYCHVPNYTGPYKNIQDHTRPYIALEKASQTWAFG